MSSLPLDMSEANAHVSFSSEVGSQSESKERVAHWMADREQQPTLQDRLVSNHTVEDQSKSLDGIVDAMGHFLADIDKVLEGHSADADCKQKDNSGKGSRDDANDTDKCTGKEKDAK